MAPVHSESYSIYLAYWIVRYQLAKSSQVQKELYQQTEGQWMTIGGHPDPKTGQQHKGGSPVKVSPTGKIVAGPAALKGQSIASLPKRRKKDIPGQATFWEKPVPQKQFQFPQEEPEESQPKKSYRHPIPPTTKRLPGGRIVGHALVTIEDLDVDPEKFQYKTEDVDPTTGVTAELKEIDVYRPEFGGQLLVWRDPKTGTNYVVNGHHRFELAKRSQYHGPMAVYFIDAKTPSEARAIGALANIAEGRGTAIDAAKFMRESSLGPEDLKKQGISLKGQIAAKAAVLRHLTPKLFREITMGRLSEAHALAIGTYLWDEPDLQEQLFHDMQKRGRFSVEELGEVAREMKSLSQMVQQKGLFGEEETRRSYIWEKAYLRAQIKQKLGEQLRAFTVVSQERKASVLEEAGNVIAKEANLRRKKKLEEAQWQFEIEAARRSEVSRILNQYAEAIFQNPKAKKTLAAEAYQEVVEYLGLPSQAEDKIEETRLLTEP